MEIYQAISFFSVFFRRVKTDFFSYYGLSEIAVKLIGLRLKKYGLIRIEKVFVKERFILF